MNLLSFLLIHIALFSFNHSLVWYMYTPRIVRAKLGQVPSNHTTSAGSITPIKPPGTKRGALLVMLILTVLILPNSVEITCATIFCTTSLPSLAF